MAFQDKCQVTGGDGRVMRPPLELISPGDPVRAHAIRLAHYCNHVKKAFFTRQLEFVSTGVINDFVHRDSAYGFQRPTIACTTFINRGLHMPVDRLEATGENRTKFA